MTGWHDDHMVSILNQEGSLIRMRNSLFGGILILVLGMLFFLFSGIPEFSIQCCRFFVVKPYIISLRSRQPYVSSFRPPSVIACGLAYARRPRPRVP